MGLGRFLKHEEQVSVFKVVGSQDGGWSLMPMENLLRGLRNHNEMLSLELFGVDGVVNYGVRSSNGSSVGGVLSSYFPQADIESHLQDKDNEVDRNDWLYLNEGEYALVQPVGFLRESFLPFRVFDDGTIEQNKVDPLAGVIGLLAGTTRPVGGNYGGRLGLRLVLRPAEENWNAPWQDRMQQRRDGEDRKVKSGAADTGMSTGTMMALLGLTVMGGGNFLFWEQGNYLGLGLFNGLAGALGLGGVALARKFGGNKSRTYMDELLVEAKLKSLAFWSELQLIRVFRTGDPNMRDTTDVAKENVYQLLDCLRAFDDPAGNSWDPGKMLEFNGEMVFQGKYGRHPFVGGGHVLSWLNPKRAQRTALSAREVASVWHPPLGVDEMASMDRTAAGVLVPYLADLIGGDEDSGPLVGVGSKGEEIRLPESAVRKHAVILGRSGVGKTTMVKHVVDYKLKRKAAGKDNDAIVVIDPHADLVRDILKMVPPSIAHKVRLLDFGRMDRVPGINLVDPYLFPDRDRCVDTIIGTVKHLWEHWGGRLEDLLKRSLLIVYEFNQHPETSRDQMLTMLDILALLEDGEQVGSGRDAKTVMSDFQRFVLSRVNDARLKQWFQAYLGWDRSLRAEAVGPVHSRIGAYASDQRASVIMGQRESTIMLSDVLTEGLVLLVSTARGTIGEGPAALMGGTMVSLVESALRGQENIPQRDRARCLLVCDEFQTVTGANWEGLLAEIRKYGCSLMLVTQSLARLDTPERKLKAGILGNVGCIVGYQMSAEDARIIAPEMDQDRVQEKYLVNLNPHNCYVRINSDTRCYPAFSMLTLPPPDEVRGSEESERAVLAASEAYTCDWREASERLNEEVRERLESSNKIGGGSEEGSGQVSSFEKQMQAVVGQKETEGALKGIKVSAVEDSAFSPDVLKALAEKVNSDPAVGGIVDKRVGGHISRERRKARADETDKIREEERGVLAGEREKIAQERAELEEVMEGMREKIRLEEEAKARAVMAEDVSKFDGPVSLEKSRRAG